uniref:Predicted protein n=1 Tax=Hordeum vulgare subsp. vulgare TaxID=112509 RepID=F2EDL9_HORVV|nr:predicted protein [Hordeum vulgare subsp. vulgare]
MCRKVWFKGMPWLLPVLSAWTQDPPHTQLDKMQRWGRSTYLGAAPIVHCLEISRFCSVPLIELSINILLLICLDTYIFSWSFHCNEY